nr:host-specific nitrogen fixation protein [Bradyrhizobium japonicum]
MQSLAYFCWPALSAMRRTFARNKAPNDQAFRRRSSLLATAEKVELGAPRRTSHKCGALGWNLLGHHSLLLTASRAWRPREASRAYRMLQPPRLRIT